MRSHGKSWPTVAGTLLACAIVLFGCSLSTPGSASSSTPKPRRGAMAAHPPLRQQRLRFHVPMRWLGSRWIAITLAKSGRASTVERRISDAYALVERGLRQ